MKPWRREFTELTLGCVHGRSTTAADVSGVKQLRLVTAAVQRNQVVMRLLEAIVLKHKLRPIRWMTSGSTVLGVPASDGLRQSSHKFDFLSFGQY